MRAPISHQIIFTDEYAKARAPYRVSVQGSEMLGPCLIAFGTEDQKRRFLPGILSGEELWCQGFSEPDAGSDLPNLRTRAVLDGDEWVVDGQKTWTSMGHFCDWIYALVRTDPSSVRNQGISVLLIDMNQPGVETRPISNIANGVEFDDTFFNGARTPTENVLGPLHEGFKVAMAVLGLEHGTAVLPYQMMFEREVTELIELSRRRGTNADPVIRDRLVDAWVGMQVMRLNNERKLTLLIARRRTGAGVVVLQAVLGFVAPASRSTRDERDGRGVSSRRSRLRARQHAAFVPGWVRGDDLRRHQRDSPQHDRRTRARAAQGAARHEEIAERARCGRCGPRPAPQRRSTSSDFSARPIRPRSSNSLPSL